MRIAGPMLVVLLAAMAGVSAARGRDRIAFGRSGVTQLGNDVNVAVVAREYRLDGPRLKAILNKDKDLGVDKNNRKLVYACSTIPANIGSTNGRRMHGEEDTQHDHNHHHVDTSLLGLPRVEGERGGRALLQLIQANLVDPAPGAVPVTTTGVPLLHSRPGAARKVYLDFDGHTTR
jgi:hypothetical protein